MSACMGKLHGEPDLHVWVITESFSYACNPPINVTRERCRLCGETRERREGGITDATWLLNPLAGLWPGT